MERIKLSKRTVKSTNGTHTFTVFLDNQVVGELKLTSAEHSRWCDAITPPADSALVAEIEAYRKALETIRTGDCVPWDVADQALKQQHNGS